MNDDRLRELERRAHSGGSSEDESIWLRARVQAGELEPTRLGLAAYLGHQPALQVAPEVPPPPPVSHGPSSRLVEWVCGLSAWGLEPPRSAQTLVKPAWGNLVLPRVAVAVARLLPPPADVVDPAHAAELYLLAPCRETSEGAARRAAEHERGSLTRANAFAVIAALHCAPSRTIFTIRAARLVSGCRVHEATFGLDTPGWLAGAAALGAAESLGEELVRSAIRAELVPWVLGSFDPVRERVAPR